ncbi:hypothetical protein Tco_1332363, partial [Tanacetum coccineum]
MVAYLEKSEGSEGFHQIIDFLTASHIKNALIECPNLYASPIEQFWQTAALSTTEDGVRGISTTIDRKVKVFISEASIRRHFKLEDSEGLKTLPTAEIFEQLALIGTFPTPTLTQKQFSNMKRASKGYSGVDIPLFPTMFTTPDSSPSRITSSPSLSPQTHPSTLQPPSTPPSNQTTPVTKEAAPMPHESPLQSVHSLGRDEGSLSLNELTDLCTSLSKKVESLESKLNKQNRPTKLIKRVNKLEQTIKISQSRRRAKVVISDAEEDKEDPSKQGAATALVDAARRRQSVKNVQAYTRRSRLVSTTDVSTASKLGSTAGELAKKVFEEEQAMFKAEQEQEKSDFETALELQKQLDEREEVVAQAHDIDWSDLVMLRYHTLQNRPFSVAKVRKNMFMYLKNQGGYKLSHFKGMSYEDIRPIFKRVWDQNQAFVPKDSEIEKEVMNRSGFNLQQEFVKKDEALSFVQKKPARGSRKKSLARKRARETLSEESAK